MKEYTKFFKENKGYDRLIQSFLSKYKSFGKVTGSFKICNLSSDEAFVFSRFFGVRYYEGDDITVSVSKFLKIMADTRFEDFDIEKLVSEYYECELVSNKEVRDRKEDEKREFYREFVSRSGVFGKWLSYVLDKRCSPYVILEKKYNSDRVRLRKELENLCNLIQNLPKEKTLLSIYASMCTMDPHYLDLDSASGNLFFYLLAFVDERDYPSSREEKIRLLFDYNLEIDNLSNFVVTYGLISDREAINDFSRNKESLILNMQNIVRTNMFDTDRKKVFIFENPSMLSTVMGIGIDASVIISGGFPNTCVYLLLDKLIRSGNKLYYNGDFDPEGLLIAQMFKDRYGDRLDFMCYDKAGYECSVSKKCVSDARLKKLDKINETELEVVKLEILDKKMAGYQENNKDRVMDVVRTLIDG